VYLEKVSETKFRKLQKLCFGNKFSETFWCIQDLKVVFVAQAPFKLFLS